MYRTSAGEDATLLVTAFASKLFAIDRSTGEIRWKVAIESLGTEVDIAVGGGVVIAATFSKIAFVEYLTGRVLVMANRAGTFRGRATMLVDGPHVYVGGSGQVECYSTAGQLLWVQGFPGEGTGSVALGVPGTVRQADRAT